MAEHEVTRASYGIPGYWMIYAALTTLMENYIGHDQIQLTLYSLAEDAERTEYPWKMDDGCINPISDEAVISTILVAHVALKLMEEDLDLIEDPRAVEFIQPNSRKMQELLDNEVCVAVSSSFLAQCSESQWATDTIEKPETNGTRKKEKTSVEDAKQMPKKKKAKTEEKENVDDSPRPKKKNSKPARTAPKTQALSLDDFKSPPIKTARKKAVSTQKTPAPSTSPSYSHTHQSKHRRTMMSCRQVTHCFLT
ncbi:hypothetical protein C8F01DRAFT_1377070, partial [Mycena amicta]